MNEGTQLGEEVSAWVFDGDWVLSVVDVIGMKITDFRPSRKARTNTNLRAYQIKSNLLIDKQRH